MSAISPFLTSADVRRLFHYENSSRAAFLEMCRRQGVPMVRLNARTFLFPRVDLERWLEGRAVGCSPAQTLIEASLTESVTG